MRSIRLSLLVYSLVLLTLVLGAVSYYSYQVTQQTLQAKEDSARGLLQAEYENKRRELGDQFDDDILRVAHQLAQLVLAQYGPSLPRYYPLGLLTAIPAGAPHFPIPQGPWLVPAWLADHAEPRSERRPPEPSPLLRELWRGYRPAQEIKFAQAIMLRDVTGQLKDYFQVYRDTGQTVQRSTSLGTETLPLDPQVRGNLQLYEARYGDHQLESGDQVRYVVLKAPVSQQLFVWFPFRQRPPPTPHDGGSERRQPPAGPPPPQPVMAPTIFIQYARDTSQRDANLASLQQELKQRVADLRQESLAAYRSVRARMLLLCGIAFGATVIGVIWLVGRGLSPIRRITHAVSQVSEKDFQLRLGQRDVPKELAPIVEKLQYTLESLGSAFAREKQAAADISHELRTPIAALRTTIQVCLKKPRPAAEYRETLEGCAEISNHLGVLVERLLVLARLDAGADKVRPDQVDVPKLAGECVALVRPLAEAQGLTLRLERNGPAVLQTDPEKLRDILTNLLHNAIQYNRPEGSIELAVQRHNGTVQVEVRDTGIGIPPEARTHLFERFYRVDPSRHSDTVHAGLGLAIVKGYLDLMGGTIEVESEEGRGSTFRVSLPVAKVES
jgi:heavy metal sensor kinase